MTRLRTIPRILALAIVSITIALAAHDAVAQQHVTFQLDNAKSGADITLVGNLHTVEGTFTAKRGHIQFAPASGQASGEIVFDATSGKTGNDSRDKKMHKDVIESARFPEIAFRPDRADGVLATTGDSTLQVHGMFAIHGDQHEITAPVTMHVENGTWSAKCSFTVPYAKWGMKNPTVLFLKVGDDVKVQFHASGTVATVNP